jgi:hypothetical protein
VVKAKCVKRLSDELKLAPRRLSGGRKIRTTILKNEKSCWTVTKRKTRKDALSEETKKTCYEFWLSSGISRPTGNKKDVKRERLGPKLYTSHVIYVLEKTQTEAYLEFKKAQPDIKISQRMFDKCRPFFVRPVRQQDRQTCCCRYHVETKSLFKSCMNFRKKILSDKEDEIENVPENVVLFNSLSEVGDATLCPATEGNIDIACLDRKCDQCGVQNLQLLPEEKNKSDDAPMVQWETYEYVNIKVKNKTIKKLMLVKKETCPGDMFDSFLKMLTTFAAHQDRAVWQQKQIKSLTEHLPLNDCVCIHDFSENYRCTDKLELQSAYFQKTEVTIHVTIIHRHAMLEYDGIQSTEDDPEIITEAFHVISPDQQHDHHFVHQVQSLVNDHLKSISYQVETMHEFTDGCCCQYKSRHCFGDMCSACSEFGYKRFIRNYFETAHAKGNYIVHMTERHIKL